MLIFLQHINPFIQNKCSSASLPIINDNFETNGLIATLPFYEKILDVCSIESGSCHCYSSENIPEIFVNMVIRTLLDKYTVAHANRLYYITLIE